MWANTKSLSNEELSYEALMNSSSDEENELLLDDEFNENFVDENIVEAHQLVVALSENETQSAHCSGENLQNGDVAAAGRSWYYVAPNADTNRSSDFVRTGKGLTDKSKAINSIIDSFKLFISDDIISFILKYTNLRATEFYNTCSETQKVKNGPWVDVDETELCGFFGILILSGRFKETKEKSTRLWSAVNSALNRPIYQATMSRNRFRDILRFISFDDFTTRNDRRENDKLAAIREVTDIFAKNCRDSYIPSAYGTIDEHLVTFKGCCPFRLWNIPNKPGKYGMKVWALCDAQTFYLCNFEVYLGQVGNIAEHNQGPQVVKTLATPWYGSGRNITTDNFFTDLTLAEELLTKNLTIVGSVRKELKDLPRCLLELKKRDTYSSMFLFAKDMTLVSYVTKPKNCVVLLSSMHHQYKILGKQEKFKPEIMLSYNKTKSSVDMLDKLIQEYTCKRSTRRWPLRLFSNWIDVACYNAFIIWLLKYPNWNKDSTIKVRRKLFLEELGQLLTHGNIVRRAAEIQNNGRRFSKATCSAIESTGVDLTKIPNNSIRISGQKRGRCLTCRGNNNKYSKRCDKCQRFVCPQHSLIEQTIEITCKHCLKIKDESL